MEIISVGHSYALKDFDTGEHIQEIDFIKKKLVPDGDTEMYTVKAGTTNEEVLEVLINRTEYLNKKFPDKWNNQAILHLKMALEAFETRTKERVKRNVEGKHIR